MNLANVERGEFMNNFWDYYLLLEKNFLEALNYVELDKRNFGAFSKEFIKQYQTIGAELDTLFKLACGFELKEDKNMRVYAKVLLEEFPGIKSVKITVMGTDIILCPFKDWSDKKDAEPLSWWKGFNGVKHNRIEGVIGANLENILLILSALYILEKYVIKKAEYNPDVPNRESELFKIEGWETNTSVYERFYV